MPSIPEVLFSNNGSDPDMYAPGRASNREIV